MHDEGDTQLRKSSAPGEPPPQKKGPGGGWSAHISGVTRLIHMRHCSGTAVRSTSYQGYGKQKALKPRAAVE